MACGKSGQVCRCKRARGQPALQRHAPEFAATYKFKDKEPTQARVITDNNKNSLPVRQIIQLIKVGKNTPEICAAAWLQVGNLPTIYGRNKGQPSKVCRIQPSTACHQRAQESVPPAAICGAILPLFGVEVGPCAVIINVP